MKTFMDWLERFLAVVMTGLFALLICPVVLQILARYVSFIPRYIWTEEIARFCFIWVDHIYLASTFPGKVSPTNAIIASENKAVYLLVPVDFANLPHTRAAYRYYCFAHDVAMKD